MQQTPRCRPWRFAAILLVASMLPAIEENASGSTLYVADYGAGVVRQFDAATGAPIGSGIFVSGGAPFGITVDPGNGDVYVADANAGIVREYDAAGSLLNGSFASFTPGPVSLAFSGGNLFISNFIGNDVLEFNGTTGAPVGSGVFASGLAFPSGLATDAAGDVYVANSSVTGPSIDEFSPMGTLLHSTPAAVNAMLDAPAGITFGPDGSLYVANQFSGTILKVAADLSTASAFATESAGDQPAGILFDGSGKLLVANSGDADVVRYNSLGTLDTTFTIGGLSYPIYLAMSPVPEPSSAIPAGIGTLVGLGWLARRSRQAGRRA